MSADDAQNAADKLLDIVLKDINGVKRGQKKPTEIKIGKLGEIKSLNIPAIPTGSLALDLACGVGGVPEGRIVEIFGPESSGKTTLCLHVIAEAQKLGKKCAFIDVEHTLDPTYAQAIGVNIDDLIFAQPNSGNEAMQWIDRLVRTGAVKIIVIDSIAALTTEAELEGNIDKTHVGQQARLMSQALKVLTTTTGNSGTTLLFTNQIRMKIGTMYGNPETTPGGEAMKFYASQRWDIRRREPIKQAGETIGAKTRVKIVKNKVAAPFKEAHFDILYGIGIDKEKDVVVTGTEVGIVERAGAWYSFDGEKIGQGLDNAAAYLISKPEKLDEVRKRVLEFVRPKDELQEED